MNLDWLALIGESRVPGNHKEARDFRKISNQVLGNTIAEILLLRIVTDIIERQHGNRRFVRQWKWWLIRYARLA